MITRHAGSWHSAAMTEQPTAELGEFVHYVSHGSLDGTYPSKCRVAVITDATPARYDYEGLAAAEARGDAAPAPVPLWSLVVLNPTGLFFTAEAHSAMGKAGTWHHYPECPFTDVPASPGAPGSTGTPALG